MGCARWRKLSRRTAFLVGIAFAACGYGYRYRTPLVRARDARFGYFVDPKPRSLAALHDAACRDWSAVIRPRDPDADSHVSYPETNPRAACYTPVHHQGDSVRPGPIPEGCGFPSEPARPVLVALADRIDPLLACRLDDRQRAAARRHDAAALRVLAARTDAFPYAAIVVPGYGQASQGASSIAGWLPGDRCRLLSRQDREALGPMNLRARRAAAALHGRVAPVAIVSGGAVHSRLVEAFALLYLLTCGHGVSPEQVLLEPCAEHTHENLRNGGRWLVAMGARSGYVLTDDGQGRYFQDYSGYALVLGSLDMRLLSDFGHLAGSWRQASEGIDAGFWYTPYRFWAEPRDGLGSFTCLDD